jgi:hypothetical protein
VQLLVLLPLGKGEGQVLPPPIVVSGGWEGEGVEEERKKDEEPGGGDVWRWGKVCRAHNVRWVV